MAQFTVTGLARLLANVEREILVEALEKADLIHLLPLRHLAILEDIEGNWNTVFNVFLAGDILAASEALKTPTRPSNILAVDAALASIELAQRLDPTGLLNNIFRLVDAIADKVEALLTEEEKPEPEEPEEPDKNFIIFQIVIAYGAALEMTLHLQKVADFLDNHDFHPTEHPDVKPDLLLIDVDRKTILSRLDNILDAFGETVTSGPIPTH